MVGDIKTHYFEAGEGEALILLHSGEFGACAELSWEFNIEALSEHFHVYAPDWLGYGYTEKLFSFDDMLKKRVQHIRDFMRTLYIESAHFIGNSMGGSTLITVAAQEQPIWNMNKIIVVSGGGFAPENEARETLNTYDCTREHMKKLLQAMFHQDRFWSDEAYVDKRYRLSLIPGAWECTAAARFKSPPAKSKGTPRPKTYETVKCPTLLVTGKNDKLRHPGYAKDMHAQIPNSVLVEFDQAGHCPHIEHAQAFNRLAIDFLTGTLEKGGND